MPWICSGSPLQQSAPVLVIYSRYLLRRAKTLLMHTSDWISGGLTLARIARLRYMLVAASRFHNAKRLALVELISFHFTYPHRRPWRPPGAAPARRTRSLQRRPTAAACARLHRALPRSLRPPSPALVAPPTLRLGSESE